MVWFAVLAAAASLWPRVAPPMDAPPAAAATADSAVPSNVSATVSAPSGWQADEPGRRLATIIRLGTLARQEDVRWLSTLLDSGEVSVRLAAARALVRAGHEETLVRVCAQAAAEDAPRRFEALTVLREAALLPAVGRRAAERALGDADPAMRLLALDVLAIHPSSASAPMVAGVVADGSRDVRLASLRVLGAAPDARALLPLLDRLDSADRAERIAVLEILGAFRDVHPNLSAGPAVLRQVHDPNDDVRIAAIDALARLRWAPAVSVLRTVATDRSRARARERPARRAAVALGALARTGNADAIAALVELLRDPVPIDEVVVALRRSGAAAIPGVATVLKEGSSTSAIAAAGILGELRHWAATPHLVDALQSAPTLAVAISAANALGRLRDPAAVPALKVAVSGSPTLAAPGVREACLGALTATGDVRAAEIVEAAATDAEPRVRSRALELAATIRAGLSRETLAARLADPEPRVRRAAIGASSQLAALNPVPLLIERLAGGDAGESTLLAQVLEVLVAETDRAAMIRAFARMPEQRRPFLLPAMAAPQLTGGALGLPLPKVIESSLLRALASGDGSSARAADLLAGSRMSATTLSATWARFPTLQAPVRARLTPAFARARNRTGDGALARIISADPDPGVRAAAAWVAHLRSDVPTVAEALDRARSDAHFAVAANALTALATARAATQRTNSRQNSRPDTQRTSVRLRVVSPDGKPDQRRWMRLWAPGEPGRHLWALTDHLGEAVLEHLPPGPYRLSTGGADQLALTAATASGRSLAITPAAP